MTKPMPARNRLLTLIKALVLATLNAVLLTVALVVAGRSADTPVLVPLWFVGWLVWGINYA